MEVAQIAYMISCSTLFAIGGTSGFNKAFRRYGIPLATTLYLVFVGVVGWKVCIVAVGLCAVLHFGYGENSKPIKRVFVFLSYYIPSIILGFTIWQIISPIVTWVIFKLSNVKFVERHFPHKIWEFVVGLLISITVITAGG